MRRSIAAALVAIALALGGMPACAGQTDPRLDALFAKLKATSSEGEAKIAELIIWQIWTENDDPDTEQLLQHGIAALTEDDEQEALEAFDQVVKRDEAFAEGWNKRATVEFMMGDYAASVGDIERTLTLEPRHFGALSGLGQIYLALDRKPAALKAFQAALAIDPHLPGVREQVEKLEKELGGDPI